MSAPGKCASSFDLGAYECDWALLTEVRVLWKRMRHIGEGSRTFGASRGCARTFERV